MSEEGGLRPARPGAGGDERSEMVLLPDMHNNMPPKKIIKRTRRPHIRTLRLKSAPPANEKGALRFLALGGCGEVTRSMYIYEYEDDIVIIDMGLQFAAEDMP